MNDKVDQYINILVVKMASKYSGKWTYVNKCGIYLFFLQIFVGLVYNNVVSGDYCETFGSGKCICTDDFVECHGEHAMVTKFSDFIHRIQDNVTRIIITGADWTELPRNVFGACPDTPSLVLRKLKKVDLSNNNIQIIHGKSFHCMHEVTDLNLAHNEWEIDRNVNHTGYLSSLPNLRNLDLTNTFQEVWDGRYHIPKLVDVLNATDLTKLEKLSLAMNEFYVFHEGAAASLCQMSSLKHLNLSHNLLEKLVLKRCMKKLVSLDLSHNKLERIEEDLRNVIDALPNLQEVKLDFNRFKCDCGLIDTHAWLKTTRAPINKELLLCEEGYHSSYFGKPVISLEQSDLKCEVQAQSSSAASVVVGIIIAIVACALIGFIFINRNKLKYLVGNCRKKASWLSVRMHTGYSSVQEVATIENV